MTSQHTPDALAEASALARTRAARATTPALRIFYRACAEVLDDALASEMKELEDV